MFYKVYSQADIVKINPQVPHLFITITDPDMDHVDIKPNELCNGILKLKFWDDVNVEKADKEGYRSELFTYQHVDKIFEFLTLHTYNHKTDLVVNTVFVNCVMGRCRSAGVAAALAKIEHGDDREFFTPRYNPNMLVYRTILNTYYNSPY